jgi:ribosomal protein S18 acetylase RimI-like enzyme
MIRKASIDDLSQIVDVHLASFDGFFLSSLGPGFLMTFYQDFLLDENGCCIVCDEDGRTVGFVVGVVNPAQYFRRTFRKRFIPLALGTLKSILKDPTLIIKLLNRAITYPDKSPEKDDVALLSSIAVLPEYHNKRIGEKLVVEFIREMKNKGASEVTLTTDKLNNERVIRFYQKMGFKIDRAFKSYEGREMYDFIIGLNDYQPEISKD